MLRAHEGRVPLAQEGPEGLLRRGDLCWVATVDSNVTLTEHFGDQEGDLFFSDGETVCLIPLGEEMHRIHWILVLLG